MAYDAAGQAAMHMDLSRCETLLCAGVLAASLAHPAAAQTPQGAEFQVNTYTTASQNQSSVAVDAQGDFVVQWKSDAATGDTSNTSQHAQRYASDGTPQAGQFQVNTYTTNHQLFPSVAIDANGNFVATWDSIGSSGTDTTRSVQAQRYASDGTPQGGQFQVNTYTTNVQYVPSVAMDRAGNFVVVWESFGSSGTDIQERSIQGQRYASSGTPLGAQFQVNTYTSGLQGTADVALDADGDFVVVWRSFGSFGTDTDRTSIQGQRYASNGTPQGVQFQVNTYTTSDSFRPSVSIDLVGNFVVVWDGTGSLGSDSSGYSVLGQRYAANGSPLGGEFQVNTSTSNRQAESSVAMGSTGDFVVVWGSDVSPGDDTGLSIVGQLYDPSGAPTGSEFQVNTTTTNNQRFPVVGAGSSGQFVVAWTSRYSSGSDTSYYSIQAQRYLGLPEPRGALPRVLGFGLVMLLARRHNNRG